MAQRRTLIQTFNDQSHVDERAKEKFCLTLDKSYKYDGDDMFKKALQNLTDDEWKEAVEEDSKNYDPSHTTEEKIRQNRDGAIELAMKRVKEAGYNISEDNTTPEEAGGEESNYPKLDPPPIEPLPPIGEEDFKNVQQPALNPKELGISPPPLPHKLIDLVPKAMKADDGIGDGVLVEGTFEEGWAECDSKTMIVSCTNNDQCAALLYCSRQASLIRCEKCGTVSPACPVSSASIDGDVAQKRGSADITVSTMNSSGTNDAVRQSVDSSSTSGAKRMDSAGTNSTSNAVK